MAHKLVSIVIPCFNSERWIAESICSALDQDYAATEVIVIDDGSTDQSRCIIGTFGDKIRYEFGPNRGGCAARNRGLSLAKGEWIQFLDSDDRLKPNSVSAKLEFAETSKGVVPCCAIEFMPALKNSSGNSGPDCWLAAAHDLDYIIDRGAPQTSAPLHRKADLEKVGGFRETLRHAQDFDLHLRLAAQLGLSFRSHGLVGVYIRPTEGSVSRSAGWRMHAAIAETLLHVAPLLDAKCALTTDRRDRIAQRAALYARMAAIKGAIDEAAPLIENARRLSPTWGRRAYPRLMSSTLLSLLGFSRYERLLARVRGRRPALDPRK